MFPICIPVVYRAGDGPLWCMQVVKASVYADYYPRPMAGSHYHISQGLLVAGVHSDMRERAYHRDSALIPDGANAELLAYGATPLEGPIYNDWRAVAQEVLAEDNHLVASPHASQYLRILIVG